MNTMTHRESILSILSEQIAPSAILTPNTLIHASLRGNGKFPQSPIMFIFLAQAFVSVAKDNPRYGFGNLQHSHLSDEQLSMHQQGMDIFHRRSSIPLHSETSGSETSHEVISKQRSQTLWQGEVHGASRLLYQLVQYFNGDTHFQTVATASAAHTLLAERQMNEFLVDQESPGYKKLHALLDIAQNMLYNHPEAKMVSDWFLKSIETIFVQERLEGISIGKMIYLAKQTIRQVLNPKLIQALRPIMEEVLKQDDANHMLTSQDISAFLDLAFLLGN